MEAHSSYLASTPILVYHQVTSETLPNTHSAYIMPVSQFERQMRYLHDSGYRCITLMEYLQSQSSGWVSQEKAFVLTFDDGYENFLTVAYPVLRRYGLTATVFLVANHIGELNRWDKTERAPLLSLDQIRELGDAGISFGSHTSTHPHLPDLSSEQTRDELVSSKKRLEAILDREISFLAYPYGESNNKIWGIASEAGYIGACGVITGKSGRYNLWRRPCESMDSLLIFSFKLKTWYSRYLSLLRWAREDTLMGQHLRKFKKERRSNEGTQPQA